MWLDFFDGQRLHSIDTPLAFALVGLGVAAAWGFTVLAVRIALVIPGG